MSKYEDETLRDKKKKHHRAQGEKEKKMKKKKGTEVRNRMSNKTGTKTSMRG